MYNACLQSCTMQKAAMYSVHCCFFVVCIVEPSGATLKPLRATSRLNNHPFFYPLPSKSGSQVDDISFPPPQQKKEPNWTQPTVSFPLRIGRVVFSVRNNATIPLSPPPRGYGFPHPYPTTCKGKGLRGVLCV